MPEAALLVTQLLQQLDAMAVREMSLVTGVRMEFSIMADRLHVVRAVFEDAEDIQFMGIKAASVDRLKDVCYGMIDLLDEWITQDAAAKEAAAMNATVTKWKVCFLVPSPFHCFGQIGQVIRPSDFATRIREFNVRLAKMRINAHILGYERRPIYGPSSFISPNGIVGRENEKGLLIRKLISGSSMGQDPLVIPIVGMAGIGKTALAQLVYNDAKVISHFGMRLWLSVSDTFDELTIARDIVKLLKPDDLTIHSAHLDTLFQCLRKSLDGKKFLLVLDDVWNTNPSPWESLKAVLGNGAIGSRIVVTTQLQQVAFVMGATDDHVMHLNLLSESDCWSLFYRTAFFEKKREELPSIEDIGEIVQRCKGLPLMVKTLGGFMYHKTAKKERQDVLGSKMWELKAVQQEVFQSLWQRYYNLTSNTKRCLLYCATFPKGYMFHKVVLIGFWMAQDYLNSEENIEKQELGEEIFCDLAMKSFFHNFDKDDDGNITSCKMHDIMHDFVQFLSNEECFTMEAGSKDRRELSGDTVRHLTVMCAADSLFPFPISVYKCKKLRTLLTFDSKFSTIDVESILQLKYLRTLNLNCSSVKELPVTMGELLHLRYVSLSHNRLLTKLPNSLCNLYNLQTLRIFQFEQLVELPEAIKKLINLRHLHVEGCPQLKYLPEGISRLVGLRYIDLSYNKLTYLPEGISELVDLRYIDLSHNELKYLPEGIGKLASLRFMDLSHNGALEELPNTLCNLHNLRTLHLVWCTRLKKLPEGLDNIKHLHFEHGDTLKHLSREIWRLRRLLTPFGCSLSCGDDKEASKLGDLRIFDQLQGSLSIKKLGNVKDASEAKKAQLKNIEHLLHLELDFENEEDEPRKSDAEVLNFLEPPQGLKFLCISCYDGNIGSTNWVMSLDKLTTIILHEWKYCEIFPPLGNLSSLEKLEISGVHSVKKIGAEFLGIEETGQPLFPKLKQLSFRIMQEWEDWEGVEGGREEYSGITIMPCLSSLQINSCSLLKALPNFLWKRKTPLHELRLDWCPILAQWCQSGRGKEWISNIPNIMIDGEVIV